MVNTYHMNPHPPLKKNTHYTLHTLFDTIRCLGSGSYGNSPETSAAVLCACASDRPLVGLLGEVDSVAGQDSVPDLQLVRRGREPVPIHGTDEHTEVTAGGRARGGRGRSIPRMTRYDSCPNCHQTCSAASSCPPLLLS